jgi:hypothetical protein
VSIHFADINEVIHDVDRFIEDRILKEPAELIEFMVQRRAKYRKKKGKLCLASRWLLD